MGKNKIDKKTMDQFILENIGKHNIDIVKLTSLHFDISRQTVYRHIKNLINEGYLTTTGEKRITSYILSKKTHGLFFDLGTNIDEELIWRNSVKPLIPDLPANIIDILHYGVAEMVNNVIDHSGATELRIIIEYDYNKIQILVIDNGIGIFTKVQNDFNLADKRHAILEIAKGKLTSDPSKHSGEGIFFTSRMFDVFIILSDDLIFSGHYNNDLLFDGDTPLKGTIVTMRIGRRVNRTMKEIFDRFTPDIDSGKFGFTKTTIPVKIMQYEGESLVSRSQAKRLITRFDQFQEVVLDFEGVKIIGQPFADEVFRVFRNEHIQTHIYPINTNEDIDKMISHVTRDSKK